MMTIDLVNAPSNIELEVVEINSGNTAKKRLISMGLHPGDKIIKLYCSSWCPILVKNNTMDSSKIAIGRRLASKIHVRYNI